MEGMRIAFFGSSLVSAYGNGAATYYRGIVHAMHRRGHRVTFFEPDAFERQAHRDLEDPDWAEVAVYPATDEGVWRAIERARGADLVIKASGVGVFDQLLERAIPDLRTSDNLVAFWDVDATATLDRMHADPDDPFRVDLPRYDLVLTYGGGEPVIAAYRGLGARRCVPIHDALDPVSHHPVPPDPRFAGALGFLGNRRPDRAARVEELFLRAAALRPEDTFILGGGGWGDTKMPRNVRHVGHVYTADHSAFDCTPRAVLVVDRDGVARYGSSPPTRVFEAAGAGACLVTDAWEGIESFLEPDREILLARSGEEVAAHLAALDDVRARAIGKRARARMLAGHTYEHRVEQLEELLAASHPRWTGRGVATTAAAPRGDGRRRDAVPERLRVVVLGLSLTSSWGNGHATTYRALVRELCRRGHDVHFLERDVPWYAGHRDLPVPPFGRVSLYGDVEELRDRFAREIAAADVVIVGSRVPEGVEVGELVLDTACGVTAFYDLDTPVTLAALARGACEYLAPHLVPRYDAYLSFTGGPTLQRIERELGSPCARALYGSVDPEVYRPIEVDLRWDLGFMGTYHDDRQPTVDALLVEPARRTPRHRFVVAGAMYPAHLAWPDNVERLEHVPPGEHPAFYAAMRYTLDVTRADVSRAGWSPSVRLFEAAACGTPIISDGWPGLETFFRPDREILIARDAAEVEAILVDDPEETRLARAERARDAVLAAHTAAHRAEELERIVLDRRDRVATRPRMPIVTSAGTAAR